MELRIFWGKGVMELDNMLVYPVGNTSACRFASAFLEQAGIRLVDHAAPEVTHLMLDVPSFGADGLLRGGGDLKHILEMLPENAVIVGGNLVHPALKGYQTLDLLKDAQYLAKNAAITADCALQVAAPLMTATFAHSPALIIGWGRIGKCLGQLLRSVGSEVTIAARKETDRAMIRALGFDAVEISKIPELLPKCRLLFNTAPELILRKEEFRSCKHCIKIDLASTPGIEGDAVVWARGLPGVYAPESSGRLIAETFLRLSGEVS